QIDDDPNVANAIRKGTHASRRNLEDRADLLNPTLQFQDRGVESFDVANHQAHAGAMCSINHLASFGHRTGDGLLHENVDAAIDGLEHDLVMQPGRHHDGHKVDRSGVEHLVNLDEASNTIFRRCSLNGGGSHI